MKTSSSSQTLALLGTIALTRFLFRSHYLYDLDSVNFALGLRRFDPLVHQPHPPGYFLYICLGRLLSKVFPDPNTALVAISILASCGAAWLIFLLTREWFGERAAIFSLVLFASSPLIWFHGVVALTYIVEAFFSALVGLLCWKAIRQKRWWIIAASAAFALSAGFRPSGALFLAPLWLLALWHSDRTGRLLAVLTAALVGLGWVVPMLHECGGLQVYVSALAQAWRIVPARRTTLQSPALAIARSITILWVFVLCMGPSVLVIFRSGDRIKHAGQNVKRFIWIWITPALLFFALVFFNYVNSGYLLIVCPPVCAWLAAKVDDYLVSIEKPVAAWAMGCTLVLINIAVFLFAPLYCTYTGIRSFEQQLTRAQQALQTFDPEKTLVIAFDSHFLGFRHAGYYLPGFLVAQYPEVSFPDRKKVFTMRFRDTQLATDLPVKEFEQFVFFPLPSGTEYEQYRAQILDRLPPGSIQSKSIRGIQVFTGSVDAVSGLFPTVVSSGRNHP